MTVGDLKAALSMINDDMELLCRDDSGDAYFLDVHTQKAVFGNGYPVSPLAVAVLTVSKGVPLSKKVA